MIDSSRSSDLSVGIGNLNIDDIYSSIEFNESTNVNPLSTTKDKSFLSSAAWLFQGNYHLLLHS